MSFQDTQKTCSSQESSNLRKHLMSDRLEARLFLAGNPLCRKLHRQPIPVFSQGDSCRLNPAESPCEKPVFDGQNPAENQPENSPYFLIHGNKASTRLKQGLHRPFDDFNPDYTEASLCDRLGRYAKAHSRAVEMANFINKKFKNTGEGNEKRKGETERAIATELKECGSYLHFRYFYTIKEVKLASMCSCKRHLLCPLCAIRRAAKTVKAYMDKYEKIQKEDKTLTPYLVTFTVKDGDDLQERFEHLQDSLRLYYSHRRKYLSSKTSRHLPNESCKALGGVGSFEVKRGSGSGIWHPHAHYVWLCNGEPDASLLAQEWFIITGDSFIVDVTPFRQGKDVSGAFLEVFKYALKFSTMELSDNWNAFEVLQRRRLISSFGNFRGVDIPEQMTDEISFDELPYIELVFRYLSGVYKLTSSGRVILPGTTVQQPVFD